MPAMPLPESTERTLLHVRQIEFRGYRRGDGLYEIDGRVTDTKTRAVRHYGREDDTPAGSPIHDMWLRLVVDEDLVVRDLVAVTDASPYAVCREAVAPMAKIIGERIKAGWTNRVKELLGGAQGCTHLMELLIPLATAAYQTLSGVRTSWPDVLDRHGKPVKIDSCYAYGSGRDVVQKRWPDFYTGQESARDERAG
jgi:hypothetical protein